MRPPTIVVAGTHSGVGKTTTTLGLLRALANRGLRVQSFKCGPDFLDCLQHDAALRAEAGRGTVNLDQHMLGDGLAAVFGRYAAGCDACVVEGVMGLFDGARGADDFASTAAVAKLLGAGVVLVVDCYALARSAAAVVLGYCTFDPALRVVGVILNRVGGPSHRAWLEDAIRSLRERAPPVLGAIPSEAAVQMKERHLGLHRPRDEAPAEREARLERTAELVARHVDLDALLAAASAGAGAVPLPAPPAYPPPRARIALELDEAFCFYYRSGLDALRGAGAELVPWSPLRDPGPPPNCDALIFGGGYPELHAAELEANAAARSAVRAFGGPIYAECGGMMYLSESIEPAAGKEGKARAHGAVGLLPFRTRMGGKMAMGYCTATLPAARAALLRVQLLPPDTPLKGQVFHFCEIAGGEPAPPYPPGLDLVYRVERETPGRPAADEGYSVDSGRVLASWVHLCMCVVEPAGRPS
eukprot:tig00021434_g21369.t1